MASTYGNPHVLPPTQCSANTPSWTDTTITASSTKPRKVHIDELRTALNNELTRRGFATISWTDSTITANTTKPRKVHIDELRAALTTIHNGDCAADSYYCPQDALACADFTDPTITADSTKVRDDHITELRTKIATLMSSCICEAEQCDYCADCGHEYSYCSHNGVSCDNSQSGESCGYVRVAYNCASINSGGTHPYYKTYSCSFSETYYCNHHPSYSYSAQDNPRTVAWNMCNYTPPGNNWVSTWTCKCNPYERSGTHSEWCFR